MRVLFALPGFHRIDRGAEIALISVAKELAKTGDTVTLIGSGQERTGATLSLYTCGKRITRSLWLLPVRACSAKRLRL